MEKQALLNTYVNNVDMSETICAIEEMIASKNKSYIVAINLDVVMKIENDSYLKKIFDDSASIECSNKNYNTLKCGTTTCKKRPLCIIRFNLRKLRQQGLFYNLRSSFSGVPVYSTHMDISSYTDHTPGSFQSFSFLPASVESAILHLGHGAASVTFLHTD